MTLLFGLRLLLRLLRSLVVMMMEMLVALEVRRRSRFPLELFWLRHRLLLAVIERLALGGRRSCSRGVKRALLSGHWVCSFSSTMEVRAKVIFFFTCFFFERALASPSSLSSAVSKSPIFAMPPLALSQHARTHHSLAVSAVSSSNAARALARGDNLSSASRSGAIRQQRRRFLRRRRLQQPTEGRQTAPAVVVFAAASGSDNEQPSSSLSSPPPSASPVSDRPAWRLGPYLAPPLSLLAAALEGAWHATLSSGSSSSSSPSGSGLELVLLDPGVEYRDSADYEEDLEGGEQEDERDFGTADDVRSAVEAIRRKESLRVSKLNRKRLVVENRVYSSKAFRKIHLELAARGDGLQVLHCVLFPRLSLPGGLPILSMDIVAAPAPSSGSNKGDNGHEIGSNISLAIVDPCPAKLDLSLPQPYRDAVLSLQRECGVSSTPRSTAPEWGREIFSDACVLERPGTDEEALKRFLRYALSLHRAHLKFSEALLLSSHSSSTPSPDPSSRAETAAAHARYRQKQLENGATRGVLAAAFGKEWADRYMEEVMFDVEG